MNSTDTAERDQDEGEISVNQSDAAIYTAWRQGADIKGLARAFDLPLAEAAQRLKRVQKSKVKQGVRNHGEENNR